MVYFDPFRPPPTPPPPKNFYKLKGSQNPKLFPKQKKKTKKSKFSAGLYKILKGYLNTYTNFLRLKHKILKVKSKHTHKFKIFTHVYFSRVYKYQLKKM